MNALFSKYKIPFLGALIGGLAGWLYFRFVGCADGSCAISSNPIRSSLFGALLGLIGLSGDSKPAKTES
jgi:hypothetical protein